MISIPLFLTPAHVCSYLPNEIAQALFVHPAVNIDNSMYEQLLSKGFRRSGDDVYLPHCSQCQACLPARIAVNEFRPNRSQKRCWHKNRHTEIIIKPAEFSAEHYALYLRYQQSRHAEGEMAHSTAEDYIHFLSSTWCHTQFVEMRIAQQLAGVAVVDYFDNALSAVYTFFEPCFSAYSLGTFAVLWQIEQAKQQQREFVYLGFWIQASQKMAYKSRYQPLQLLQNNQWSTLTKI